MTRSLSPHQFKDAVQSFTPDPAWATPEGADAQCTKASECFAAHARKRGHAAEVKSFYRTEKSLGQDVDRQHHAVEIGGHVVDWTARQFDPGASHPLVEPADQYRERWNR